MVIDCRFTSRKDDPLVHRVRYFSSTFQDFEILGMVELANGAVAVHDGWDDIDVFYNPNTYQPIDTESHDQSKLLQQAIDMQLGIIPGNSFMSYPHSFESALHLVKQVLEGKGGKEIEWYGQPKLVDL